MTYGYRTYRTGLVEELTGAKRSQLISWMQSGYLPEPDSPGPGAPLEWSLLAVLKAEIMHRLTKVGFKAENASDIANEVVSAGNGIMTIDLGESLFLYQDRSVEYVKAVLDNLVE